MLTLGCKAGNRIAIYDKDQRFLGWITVAAAHGSHARLLFDFPPECRILREELVVKRLTEREPRD